MKSFLSVLWQNARRWLPGVVISLVALIAVFHLARWEDVGMAFRSIRIGNFIIAIFLTLFSLGTRAFAWRVLLEKKASFWQSFFIINEGYFLNNILPLKAGEVARAVFMGQTSGWGGFHVLSTIVIERSFDVAIAAGLLLSTLPFILEAAWAETVALTALGLVVAALIALFLLARYHHTVQNWLQSAGQRWPIIQKWVIPRLGSLLNGLRTLTRPSQFFGTFFWIALSWAIWVGMYFIMLSPISDPFPFPWAVFTTTVLALGVAIPQAPGGVGVYEASVVGALAVFGIDPSLSLAYALMMHFLQFFTTGVLGFWGLLRDRRSISAVFAQRPQINS